MMFFTGRGSAPRVVFRLVLSAFRCLGVSAEAIVFIRYRNSLLPESVSAYTVYYLLAMGLTMLAIFLIIIRELRDRPSPVFFFLPYFIATVLISMARDGKISGSFSPLVVLASILGFACTIFTFLSAAAYRERKDEDGKTGSKFKP